MTLTGEGTRGGLLLAPTSLTFSSQSVGTAGVTQTVVLTNSGSVAIGISGISTTGDFSATSDCGDRLEAGTSCSAAVTFWPTGTGTRTGILSVTGDADGSPHELWLKGTGFEMHVRIAALVLLSLGIAARADAQIRVEGIVRQADGLLAGVTVVATGLELKQKFETKTDDRGMFVFPDLNPGGWVRLTASRDGKILATQGVLVTRGLERVDLDEPGRPMPVPPAPTRRDPAAAPSFGQPPPDLPAVGPPTAASSPGPPVPSPAPTVNVVRLSGSGGVRGTVRSPDGIGLPGVVVGIDGTDTFAISDTEGHYSLVGLPVGSHLTVVASLDGFETVRSEVNVLGGCQGPPTSSCLLPHSANVSTSAARSPC